MKSIYMLWKGHLPSDHLGWWVWQQAVGYGPPPRQYGPEVRMLRIMSCGAIITDDYYGGKLEYD